MVPYLLENKRPDKGSQYLMPLAAHHYRVKDRESAEVLTNGDYDLVGKLGHGDEGSFFWSSGRLKGGGDELVLRDDKRTKKR